MKPPRIEVKRHPDNVYALYVDSVLVGTAKRHPSGLGWVCKPEMGRARRVTTTLEDAMELLRKLDQQAQWKSVQ